MNQSYHEDEFERGTSGAEVNLKSVLDKALLTNSKDQLQPYQIQAKLLANQSSSPKQQPL